MRWNEDKSEKELLFICSFNEQGNALHLKFIAELYLYCHIIYRVIAHNSVYQY